MRRQPSLRVAARNTDVLRCIRAWKAAHPFWGYRRCWAHLRYVDKLPVNKKRVLRLLRQHALLVQPNPRLRASRTPTTSKPRPTRPNEWWGIDMTKVVVESFGWVYVVVVLDWYTKKFIGYHIGLQATTAHWLAALDMAVNRQFPQGIEGHPLHLMSDNGCQPTSVRFLATCGTLGIQQAFTSYNNPKGNADTERSIRTLKEECLWLREWSSPFAVGEALATWFESFNVSYLHSSLGYRTPEQCEQQWIASHQTLLAPA
jgi:transposase InsO family protein